MSAWLFAVAALVFAMVMVGGLTRLTDSGLSITEWRPVTGAVPPLSAADWAAEFEKYRRIPEYAQVNAGMSLERFQYIYWWEWAHRFLGRFVGLAFLLPFMAFVATRRMPRRLLRPCVGLFALGGLQGAVGWWMVSSGLADRVDVAPERLTTHLGLALLLICALIWTALEARHGPGKESPPAGWSVGAFALLGLAYLQCLLGGLVAGNDAGLVYNDWPTMGGGLLPPEYGAGDLWRTLFHSQAAVQLHHRLGAYAVTAAALFTAWRASRSDLPPRARRLATIAGALVLSQAALGVLTLVTRAPASLSFLHQAWAVVVLSMLTVFAWRVRRSPAQVRTEAHGPVIASVMPGQ